MPDLFDWPDKYPHQPGHRRKATSKAGADSVRAKAPTLRDKVLSLLTLSDYTADECAAELGESILSIRPRLSELSRLGKIYDSGLTRANASGVKAIVWRAY